MNRINVEPMRFSSIIGNERPPRDVSGFWLSRSNRRQRLEVGVGDPVQVVEGIDSRRPDASGVVRDVP